MMLLDRWFFGSIIKGKIKKLGNIDFLIFGVFLGFFQFIFSGDPCFWVKNKDWDVNL